MQNITKRTWEKDGQHFAASFNEDTNDIEKVTVSRGGYDVALGWEQLTLAEQNEIEARFFDLIIDIRLLSPARFTPTSPNFENSEIAFLCRD